MENRLIICPVCGAEIPFLGSIGRKPLNHSVKNVCDAVQHSSTVSAAAKELDCSRSYIYKVLKEQKTTPEAIRRQVATKRTRDDGKKR
jgi:hypothetical protein